MTYHHKYGKLRQKVPVRSGAVSTEVLPQIYGRLTMTAHRRRKSVSLAIVFVIVALSASRSAMATNPVHGERIQRLGTTDACAFIPSDDGWGDLGSGYTTDDSGVSIMQHTGTHVWHYHHQDGTNDCHFDPIISGPGMLQNLTDTNNLYDWEDGAWKDCWQTPADSTAAWNGTNSAADGGYGWLTQWGLPCGGFAPDPADVNRGGDWNEIETTSIWTIKYPGPLSSSYTGVTPHAYKRYYKSDFLGCITGGCSTSGLHQPVVTPNVLPSGVSH